MSTTILVNIASFFQVGRSSLKVFNAVLEQPQGLVALPTEKTSYLSSRMAVIYAQGLVALVKLRLSVANLT